MSICSGKNGIKKQAAHFLQLFGRGERESILKLANILPFEVDAKIMVTMKVDLGYTLGEIKGNKYQGNNKYYHFKTARKLNYLT